MATLEINKSHSKASQISSALRRMAEEVGPEGKLPTHANLLQTLKVSSTTLNKALDELESQKVIYRRHGIGIFAAPQQKQSTIALVCDPTYFQGATHSPFWDLLLLQARKRAEAEDLFCEVHFGKAKDQHSVAFSDSLQNSLSQGVVQGVIGVGMNRATDLWMREKKINYVSFGGPGFYFVDIDNASLIQMGVQVLSQAGCQRVALLHPVKPQTQYSTRHSRWRVTPELFRMALAQHEMPFEPRLMNIGAELVREGATTHLTPQEQGYLAMQQIIEQFADALPDGVAILDDLMTLGAIAAIREAGLKLGHDIRIATHSNRGTGVLSPYYDDLFRLEIDPAQIVETMFATIHSLMCGEEPAGYIYDPMRDIHKTLIQPQLASR